MTTVDSLATTGEQRALVERAQNGDTKAFALLYRRYVDTVFRFIYWRVGNRHLAEDFTADTFRRALTSIGRFTWQGTDFGAWLVTIARNLVADHYKTSRYRLEVTTGDVLDTDQTDTSPSPDEEAVRSDTAVAVRRAVAKLPTQQRRVIELRFLDQLEHEEIAARVGATVGAVKSMQWRAMQQLRRHSGLEAWR